SGRARLAEPGRRHSAEAAEWRWLAFSGFGRRSRDRGECVFRQRNSAKNGAAGGERPRAQRAGGDRLGFRADQYVTALPGADCAAASCLLITLKNIRRESMVQLTLPK